MTRIVETDQTLGALSSLRVCPSCHRGRILVESGPRCTRTALCCRLSTSKIIHRWLCALSLLSSTANLVVKGFNTCYVVQLRRRHAQSEAYAAPRHLLHEVRICSLRASTTSMSQNPGRSPLAWALVSRTSTLYRVKSDRGAVGASYGRRWTTAHVQGVRSARARHLRILPPRERAAGRAGQPPRMVRSHPKHKKSAST